MSLNGYQLALCPLFISLIACSTVSGSREPASSEIKPLVHLHNDDAVKPHAKRFLVLGDSQIAMGFPKTLSLGKLNRTDELVSWGWRSMLAQACNKEKDAFVFDTICRVSITSGLLKQAIKDKEIDGPARNVALDEFFKIPYDGIIVQIGGNDIGGGNGKAEEKAASILALMDEVARTWPEVKERYLLSISPRCHPWGQPYNRKTVRQVREVNALLEKNAREHDVIFLDVYKYFVAENSGTLQAPDGCLGKKFDSGDGIHPSQKPESLEEMSSRIAHVISLREGDGIGSVFGCKSN